jgi:hypothetical protein
MGGKTRDKRVTGSEAAQDFSPGRAARRRGRLASNCCKELHERFAGTAYRAAPQGVLFRNRTFVDVKLERPGSRYLP